MQYYLCFLFLSICYMLYVMRRMLYMLYTINYLLYAKCYILYAMCYVLCVIYHNLYVVYYNLSGIWDMLYVICFMFDMFILDCVEQKSFWHKQLLALSALSMTEHYWTWVETESLLLRKLRPWNSMEKMLTIFEILPYSIKIHTK